MSYANLIDKQLTVAFNQLKDLAKMATLVKANGASFDFSSATAVTPTTAALAPFKVVVLEFAKGSPERKANKVQLLFKKASTEGDVAPNSKITIDGVDYRTGGYAKSEGYTVLLDATREG